MTQQLSLPLGDNCTGRFPDGGTLPKEQTLAAVTAAQDRARRQDARIDQCYKEVLDQERASRIASHHCTKCGGILGCIAKLFRRREHSHCPATLWNNELALRELRWDFMRELKSSDDPQLDLVVCRQILEASEAATIQHHIDILRRFRHQMTHSGICPRCGNPTVIEIKETMDPDPRSRTNSPHRYTFKHITVRSITATCNQCCRRLVWTE